MKHNTIWLMAGLALSLIFLPELAWAQQPEHWQKGLQPAATPVMERITDFHTLLLYVITGICIFVFALLAYIMVRFNAKANPTPSKTTHNTMLEVIWTVLPVVILVIIAVPSLKLLYYGDRVKEPEMTVKVTGYQWYWGYEYPDYEDLSFTAYLIPDDEIDESKGQKRLLSTDHQLVLPVDTDIQFLVTAADVLHSFAVPSFGVKLDGVPGRINETWARIERPGTYYGQCSELCGKGHAYMPIEIRAVSKEEFADWVKFAQEEQQASYDVFETQRKNKLAKAEGLE
ncbi:MAG: cytochrome c oxidase subunit II [Rhodospirillales bacterium]|nr:cytochrome c oxidase subunit II [Rhodospirillales bacterium]MCB9996192.1 cytochrome c oxidase subunit II [Rhodospirillales bacterium]